jgi:hypothetical protein
MMKARMTLVSLAALAGAIACGPSATWEPAVIPDHALVPPPPVPGVEENDNPFFDDAPTNGPQEGGGGETPAAEDVQSRIQQFAPAKIGTDVSKLPQSEKAALEKLIEASRLLDPVFDRQAHRENPAIEARLKADNTRQGQAKYAYFRLMRGPWDRQDHHRPFAVEAARPKGAGFYPADLTEGELDAYVAKHPKKKDELLGLFTVVERQGAELVGVPYSKAYAEWLKPAAQKLREAAQLTKNPTLKRFLTSRAAGFESDDYYQSDKDWMDLDSQVEITIGPYEVYEDELKAAKAAFESFVTITDPDASKKLAKYKALLPTMEQNLPVPDEVKTKRGAESPIRVVDLVFSAGDARKSVQTIAFNLPNDERVRKEKGAKKVLLRNVIETKFDLILKPIAARIIAPDQQAQLSSEAFFNQVLFHELSHSLGPAFTTKNGKKVEVREALENTYSALEEAKADVMGTYNILFMIEKGEFPKEFKPKLLTSYFAGLFRSVRFGVAEAHGKGAALQINRFLEAGAASFDEKSGRFTVHHDKLEKAITDLVRDLVMLQHEGNKAAAQAMLGKYGVASPQMKQALAKVGDVPVDLRPIYPVAGESAPR